MMTLVFLVAVCGAVLSGYYFYVEQQVAKNPNYKPACDINDQTSCTATMKSPYARVFYIQNSLLGIAYYTLIMMLSVTVCPIMIRYLAFTGVVATLILGYVLYTRVKVACPICISLYIVNFLLFIVAHW